MKSELAFQVRDLHFSYATNGASSAILRGIDLEIKVGEFVAIQGPSGSGKSTLLYLLGLLSLPSHGQIQILGQDIAFLNEIQRAAIRNENIGFVFQHFHLLPKTSLLDNILLPTQYSQQANSNTDLRSKAKATSYAESLGLGGHLKSHPNQLSGGQQQRVAIARALMNEPEIILADEPTGNLDSQSSEKILEWLRKLNKEFQKTVIIITHDNEVAKLCDRVIHIKDGVVAGEAPRSPQIKGFIKEPKTAFLETWKDIFEISRMFGKIFPFAIRNLGRNKLRTALTMIGVSVGIASVLSMITLGQFTKEKVLAGYMEMGVNSMMFYGYPNFEQRATDLVPAKFQFFKWEEDLLYLKKIFPEIKRMSPMLMSWETAISYGGKSIDREVRALGASEEALPITNRKLLFGRNFSQAEIEQKSSVCVIGYDIGAKLFSNTFPIGKVLSVTMGQNSFGCRIIGVMKSVKTRQDYAKPNMQVLLPFTVYQLLAGNWWSSQLKEVLIQLAPGSDIEKTGNKLKAFFKQRYGASGSFQVDYDSIMVSQMKRFLGLFTGLLAVVAFVTLTVGGIGITNMMLVSVSERYREIGLRKALGATKKIIRAQFLVEAILVCGIAGIVGLFGGLIAYQASIWFASQLISKVQFEWVFDSTALIISFVSIIVVGILSGIFPALKAEELQVIDALRSE